MIEKEMDEAPVLILEGGAMRGLFTAGVLDAFMDHRFYFKKAAGISAGTLQGLGYLSKQCGRSVRVNSAYAADPRYMGFRHMLKGGSFFNFDFMFGPLAHEEDPFDFETFEKAEEELYAVITDCLEGKPHFISSHDLSPSEFMKVVAIVVLARYFTDRFRAHAGRERPGIAAGSGFAFFEHVHTAPCKQEYPAIAVSKPVSVPKEQGGRINRLVPLPV